MILLGCEFCLFEAVSALLYGLPFVGPVLIVWLRRRRKPAHMHEHVES
jgi:hypothetical protein